MIILVLTSLSVLLILFSKLHFGKWFNHLAIYTFVWYLVIALYEIKLMAYVDIRSTAWITIAGSFISFCIGSITISLARSAMGNNVRDIPVNQEKLLFFADDGKRVKYALLFCSVIGTLAVVFQWMILIKKFGSIASVIVQTNLIYKLRVEGKMDDALPYVYIIAYVGVFFSGIYCAYKHKLTLLSVIPLVDIVLKEISNASRAGMMIAFFIFISSFFLVRHILPHNIKSGKNLKILKREKANKIKLVLATTFVIALILTSAGIVRSTRGSIENYSASSQQLRKLKHGFLITPSLYLYFSSHVGVLSEYLEKDFDHSAMFGETTLQPIYNFISKFGVVKHPLFYEKGYFIPMWTNTATYLRPIHADFGIAGLYIFPYLLGLVTSFYWYRWFEKRKGTDLVILSFLYVLIMFSYVTMISRAASWFLSLAILLVMVPFIERSIKTKLILSKYKRSSGCD